MTAAQFAQATKRQPVRKPGCLSFGLTVFIILALYYFISALLLLY